VDTLGIHWKHIHLYNKITNKILQNAYWSEPYNVNIPTGHSIYVLLRSYEHPKFIIWLTIQTIFICKKYSDIQTIRLFSHPATTYESLSCSKFPYIIGQNLQLKCYLYEKYLQKLKSKQEILQCAKNKTHLFQNICLW
jgi:hypothetical protein